MTEDASGTNLIVGTHNERRSANTLARPATKATRRAWAIMDPVRGKIRFAMALSVGSSLATLGALGCMAWVLRDLIQSSEAWRPIVGAAFCTAVAYLLRVSSFDQSHYAAFELEAVLRTQLSQHLGRISLGEVQRV